MTGKNEPDRTDPPGGVGKKPNHTKQNTDTDVGKTPNGNQANADGLVRTCEMARLLGIRPRLLRQMANRKHPVVKPAVKLDSMWLWHPATVRRALGMLGAFSTCFLHLPAVVESINTFIV